MDGSTKGWNVLRAMQNKNLTHKKVWFIILIIIFPLFLDLLFFWV